jgi:hypothetical protein
MVFLGWMATIYNNGNLIEGYGQEGIQLWQNYIKNK